jgi:hypothetical protein
MIKAREIPIPIPAFAPLLMPSAVEASEVPFVPGPSTAVEVEVVVAVPVADKAAGDVEVANVLCEVAIIEDSDAIRDDNEAAGAAKASARLVVRT